MRRALLLLVTLMLIVSVTGCTRTGTSGEDKAVDVEARLDRLDAAAQFMTGFVMHDAKAVKETLRSEYGPAVDGLVNSQGMVKYRSATSNLVGDELVVSMVAPDGTKDIYTLHSEEASSAVSGTLRQEGVDHLASFGDSVYVEFETVKGRQVISKFETVHKASSGRTDIVELLGRMVGY